MSTNIWKGEVENTGEKAGEKDRRRKDSRGISTQKILEVKEIIWKGKIEKNTYQEAIKPYDRVKRGICTKGGESVFTVKRKKGGGTSICGGSTVKRIHLTIKITTDLTSPFYSKEEQQEKNGIRLLLYKPVDSKEQVPLTPNCRYPGWSRKEEGIHET